MSTATGSLETIKNPGSLAPSKKLDLIFLICIAIGLGAFGSGIGSQAERAWSSFLLNHFYFMSLALGGAFFAAIHWITGAMWSATVRRIGEAFISYLPFALVTFVLLALFGVHHLYHWSHLDVVEADPILKGKSGYLNTGFFIIRNVGAFVLWIIFARTLRKQSLKQDATRDYAISVQNRTFSAVFLILFGLTFTMASFDVLMSLDAHWFSTIFGVYCFAGLFYSFLAMTCIITILLKRRGLLLGIVTEDHLHDLGKLMFAFTVFWAYIGFSQFMLIWYANLPEETGYFIRRFHGGWGCVSAFLLIGKFLVPFFALMPRGWKRTENQLLVVGVFMLVAQWVDLLWIIQPEFFAEGPVIGWIEIGTTLGFLGVFGILVTRFLAKNNVVAIGDPRLPEAVFHHHQ